MPENKDFTSAQPANHIFLDPLQVSTELTSPKKQVSRRKALKVFGGSAVGAAALGLSGQLNFASAEAAGLPSPLAGLGVFAVNPATDVVAYANVDNAGHQAKFDYYYSNGYRLISLSVYGNVSNPLYAAVWVKRTGPAWAAVHGVDSVGYQQTLATLTSQGYHPVILSVVGSNATEAIFAGTFEKRSGPPPLVKTHLTSGAANSIATFEYWLQNARNNNLALEWAAIYGTATNPLYAVIWKPNPDKATWNLDGYKDTATTSQERINAQTSGNQARPSFITHNAGGLYLTHYKNDQIGAWVLRSGLDTSQAQTEYDTWKAAGYYPLVIQGAGEGTNIRFRMLFGKQETSVGRQWTITGQNVSALAAVDNAMFTQMQNVGCRAASVAIVKDKKLIFGRGYTWAEPGYTITAPTTLFRIASCSKPLTSIAVHQQFEKARLGGFSEDTKVYSALGLLPPPGKTLGTNHDQVTVKHLLYHLANYHNPHFLFDVNYAKSVAQAFNRTMPPYINKTEFARFNFGQNLATPGINFTYSNWGYQLLGMLLEKYNSGQTYAQIVNTNIFQKLGLTRPRQWNPQINGQAPGEVRYYDDHLLRVMATAMPGSPPLLSMCYSEADGTLIDAAGGWLFSTPDYVKVLASFNPSRAGNPLLTSTSVQSMFTPSTVNPNYARGWSVGSLGATKVYSHGGFIEGNSSFIAHRTDGISYAVFYNHGAASAPNLDGILANIPASVLDSLPDQFPALGIPAF